MTDDKNACRQEPTTRNLKATLSRIFSFLGTGTASLAKEITVSITRRLGLVSRSKNGELCRYWKWRMNYFIYTSCVVSDVTHWHSLVRNFFCKAAWSVHLSKILVKGLAMYRILGYFWAWKWSKNKFIQPLYLENKQGQYANLVPRAFSHSLATRLPISPSRPSPQSPGANRMP